MEKSLHNLRHFKQCVKVFQFFGLFTSDLKFYEETSNGESESQRWPNGSRILKVYSVLLNILLLYLDLSYIAFLEDEEFKFDENLNSKTLLNKILQNSMHAAIGISVLTISLKSLVQSDFENKFILNCLKIDNIADETFMTKLDFQRFKKIHFQQFGCLLIVAIFSISFLLYFINFEIDAVIQLLRIAMPFFIASTMIIFKLVFYIRVINFYMDFINGLLKEVLNLEASDRYIQNKFKSKLSKKYNKLQNRNRSTKIKLMKKIYNIVEENVILLNQSENVTLFTTLLFIVITIVASGYRLLMFAFAKSEKFSSKGCE